LYRNINIFKVYQPRMSLVKDENGGLLADNIRVDLREIE
jgi:hypothetical protein